jgi:transposase
MITYKVTLSQPEREKLESIKTKGAHRSQKVLNALILLNCDQGDYQTHRSTNEQISKILGISDRKINRVKKKFVEEGFEVALHGKKPERVYQKKVDGDLEARIIATSCSKPPEGFSRWSLRMLADRMVELEFVDELSHETVRQVLKKTKSNPGNKKDG